MKKYAIILVVILLLSCGTDGENPLNPPAAKNKKSDLTPLGDQLVARTYEGLKDQGGPMVPGCEGCGNPGFIEFDQVSRLFINRPGDDQIFTLAYSSSELVVTTEEGDVLTLSADLKTIKADYGVFEFAP